MNLKKTPGLDLSGSFLSLLWKWRGSLYKLCFRELACFLVLFWTVSTIYRQVSTVICVFFCITIKHSKNSPVVVGGAQHWTERVNFDWVFIIELNLFVGIVVFRLFGKIVRYCDKYLNMVPLSFILGFYVKTVGMYIFQWNEEICLLVYLKWVFLIQQLQDGGRSVWHFPGLTGFNCSIIIK